MRFLCSSTGRGDDYLGHLAANDSSDSEPQYQSRRDTRYVWFTQPTERAVEASDSCNLILICHNHYRKMTTPQFEDFSHESHMRDAFELVREAVARGDERLRPRQG